MPYPNVIQSVLPIIVIALLNLTLLFRPIQKQTKWANFYSAIFSSPYLTFPYSQRGMDGCDGNKNEFME